MTDITPKLSLPYLLPNQAAKHVTVNQSLSKLDILAQLVVESATIADPVGTLTSGATFIVPVSPSGAFSGQDNNIARWQDDNWEFLAPQPGWRAWVQDQNVEYVFSAGNWVSVTNDVPSQLPELGIGTVSDSDNKLTAKSEGILFTTIDSSEGGSGDLRFTMNRESTANTAALLFKTGHGANAEIGLAGSDELSIRTSSDGISFIDAMTFDTVTGHVGIGTQPDLTSPLIVRKDKAGSTQFIVANFDTDSNASAAFRLNAANGYYLNFQLYSSGFVYAVSNAAMVVGTQTAAPLYLRSDMVDRIIIHTDGRVCIGTPTPAAQLTVNGAVRVGSFDISALPSAAANGPGALVWVTDASSGNTLAVSDGANWRQLDLGNILT